MDRPTARKVIIAEDDPDSRRLLQRVLERAGYEVAAFENGRLAKESIVELQSGLVVADWHMPEMTGIELLEFVRGMEQLGALRSIYFILLTAQTDKKNLVQGLNAGADDYLIKPYCPEELLARLQAGARILDLQDKLVDRQTELARATLDLDAAHRRLAQMASVDALTGLFNRRALFDRFSEYWSLSTRHRRPLSCIMLDVDRFKSVNDTYGHPAGDAVLKMVAASLRKHLRKQDICGRFGGEEFCVICPETPLEGAEIVAERLREGLAAECTTVDEHTLQVTASFGVSIRQDRDTRAEDLVNRADAMLYQAKHNGRNQVWSIDAHGRTRRVEVMAEAPQPVQMA